jgi:hypothetical protein
MRCAALFHTTTAAQDAASSLFGRFSHKEQDAPLRRQNRVENSRQGRTRDDIPKTAGGA